MAYKETVIFSGNGADANGSFTLNDLPTNYDRIRVNYANFNCFSNTYVNTTSWNNDGSRAQPFMCYEFDPSFRNIINLQNVRWGNLTITGAGTMQRSCSTRTGCNTTAWGMRFNVTGNQNSYECRNDAWYNNIESVIGIKYNANNVTPTKRTILYDIGTNSGTSAFTINECVSAYDRIGFISNVKPHSYTDYPTQLGIARYQEVPSWALMKNNNFLATNDLLVGIPNGGLLQNISIYSGCSGLNWTQVTGFRSEVTTNNAVADTRVCSIHKIIGIKL